MDVLTRKTLAIDLYAISYLCTVCVVKAEVLENVKRVNADFDA